MKKTRQSAQAGELMPHPSRLSTAVAKREGILKWADGRACFRLVPGFVQTDWGVTLEE